MYSDKFKLYYTYHLLCFVLPRGRKQKLKIHLNYTLLVEHLRCRPFFTSSSGWLPIY